MISKKICYLIFNNSPSSVVRATTFKNEFLEYNYEPFYFKLFSKRISLLAAWFLFHKLSFLALAVNKVNALFERIAFQYFLFLCKKYDAIIIIKYIKPLYLNKLKFKYKGKMLYDFDDAVWVNYIMGEDTFKKIVTNVDYVSCDNSFLLAKVMKYNFNSFILNGPTQIEKFISQSKIRNDNKIIIGWVGSPDTLFYLYSVYDALEKIGELYENVILRIIGTGYEKKKIPDFEKINIEILKTYNEQQMITEVKNFDIGIFPLFNNDLSCGRGLLKSKIYMSASVPSITSNLGTASDLIINGENGFLCNSTEEWIACISKLIENPNLRKQIGEMGFITIKQKYSKKSCFLELKQNFLDII